MKNDLAFGGIERAQDRPACCRLARTAFTHQSQGFALEDVKVDAIHSLYCPHTAAQEAMPHREIFFEVFHLEQHAAVIRHSMSPVHTKDSAQYVDHPSESQRAYEPH